MTIDKQHENYTLHNTRRIESWCQKALDLLDLSFAEPLGLTWMMVNLLPFAVHFSNFPLFLSNEGGSKWIIDETSGFLWNMQDISRGSTQAMLTRDKESFRLTFFNPS